MSLFPQPAIAGSSGLSRGYLLDRSLRFRSSASAYLTRTPSSTGDRTEWTWSGWVKRSGLAANTSLFSVDVSGYTNRYLSMLINSSDEFQIFEYTGAAYTLRLATNAVFRDPSAWYHLVCAVDTDQATSSDRVKLYVNGVQQTSLRLSDYPSSGLATYANVSGNLHAVGATVGATTTPDRYMEGYLTEINFIDGQALDPTDFGEFDEDTGVWKPKAYTGTYGTNGFYLDFNDPTSTATISQDQSGNGNDWTANNISLTSGTTYDSMTDVPTLTNEDTANFCTWNPLYLFTNALSLYKASFSNGNLDGSNTYYAYSAGTITASSGKYYMELVVTTTSGGAFRFGWGVLDDDFATRTMYRADANQDVNGTTSSYGVTWTTGDVMGCAVDASTGDIEFFKNGTSQGTVSNSSLAGKQATFFTLGGGATGTRAWTANFGQRPFAYTPPTGFKKLNTYNLPDSTIEDGSEQFNTVLYTGNGTTGHAITGVGFQPDFSWIKGRSTTGVHGLWDAVRGATKYLVSNNTAAETTDTTNGLQTFESDGFTLGSVGTWNTSSASYVSWNWKANGSGVSNSEGDITVTVSADATSGFSIVKGTYTGAGAVQTFGHGLGNTPAMIINKDITDTGGVNWVIWHKAYGSTSGNTYVLIFNTNALIGAGAYFGTITPSLSCTTSAITTNNSDFVQYIWTEIEGFSKFGSYTGNGSTDGPFIYTGFRPAWVLYKRTDAAANWDIYDSTRDTYNPEDALLRPNLANAEVSASAPIDFTATGFKIRTTSSDFNTSSGTYIYAAFAENPFKNALAR